MSKRLPVLRVREFRYLLLGQTASLIGDQVAIVALALFVTRRTGSASDLGLVLGAQATALATLLLFGGVWADRLPRRRIMITADLARAVLHLTLAGLILTGAVRLWHVIAIETAFGGAEAAFRPAYGGLLPQTVPDELIQHAAGLTNAADNASLLIGPAIATALITGVGAAAAFMLDAATFVVSAALLTWVRPRRRGGPAPAGLVWHDLRAGWREVRKRAWVWVTIVAFCGVLVCSLAPWIVLGPVIARNLFGATSAYGVLSTLIGAGALTGALIAARARPREPLRTGLLLLLAWPMYGCALALGAPFWTAAPLAIAIGAGWALTRVWWETALALRIPNGALSRVSAFDWIGSLLLLPVGYALAGPLAGALGAQTVIGAGATIAFVIITLALLRQPALSTPARRRRDGAEGAGRTCRPVHDPAEDNPGGDGNHAVRSPVFTRYVADQ